MMNRNWFIERWKWHKNLKKLKKPVVKVKQRSYQPSKAELEKKLNISATPDQLAKAAVSDVIVKLQK